jgi:hypothetical protein
MCLRTMSADEIDWLPFGVIKVDQQGTTLSYNDTEGRLAGFDPATLHSSSRDQERLRSGTLLVCIASLVAPHDKKALNANQGRSTQNT